MCLGVFSSESILFDGRWFSLTSNSLNSCHGCVCGPLSVQKDVPTLHIADILGATNSPKVSPILSVKPQGRRCLLGALGYVVGS